eukprot:TRINITY_DN12158_c1_g1_i2.p1 TRINITY_DN12158_c1_g1~~TRINITY_DN12158_c1_g1_i2.p1  ORF type:complete len:203 (-),score=0.41 TRINITY_DN12158_c1_g1_i2:846-1454(-)
MSTLTKYQFFFGTNPFLYQFCTVWKYPNFIPTCFQQQVKTIEQGFQLRARFSNFLLPQCQQIGVREFLIIQSKSMFIVVSFCPTLAMCILAQISQIQSQFSRKLENLQKSQFVLIPPNGKKKQNGVCINTCVRYQFDVQIIFNLLINVQNATQLFIFSCIFYLRNHFIYAKKKSSVCVCVFFLFGKLTVLILFYQQMSVNGV